MPIGTSDGHIYEDDAAFQAGSPTPIEETKNPTIDVQDMSSKFNTKLDPEKEEAFQAWAKDNPKLGNTYDYDARGFWQAGANSASNGHGADTWKKPNHPTFSDQSIYHDVGGNIGGKWETNDDGTYSFTPSPTNRSHYTKSQLKDYFDHVEQGNTLKDTPEAPDGGLSATDLEKGMLLIIPAKGFASSYNPDTGKYEIGHKQTKMGESGTYNIVDAENGNKRADAKVSYDEKKKSIHVSMVSTFENSPLKDESAAKSSNRAAHALGTKEVISILRDIGRVFPDATHIEGMRISGAHHEAYEKLKGKNEWEAATKAGKQVIEIPTPKTEIQGGWAMGHVNAPGGGSGVGMGAPGTQITDLY